MLPKSLSAILSMFLPCMQLKILSGIVAIIYSFYYYFPGELGAEGLSTRTWMRTLQKGIGCVIPDSADYEPLTEYFLFHMTKE